MRLIPIYIVAIGISSFFWFSKGKSRAAQPYTWRWAPSPWRYYQPVASTIEYGDLSTSYAPASYRSSRTITNPQGISPPAILKRDTNYWSAYTSVPDCEITCDGGVCVPKSYKCDGYAQCFDGLDEQGCSCAQIIPKEKLCDGYKDCPDGGDEVACVYGCKSTEFTCNSYNIGSKGKCVPIYKRCDGNEDCPTGTDEHDCFRMVDLSEESRGVRSHGILQKRVGDADWYTVCKTSTSARYIKPFAEKVCKQLSGHNEGTPKITSVSLTNLKQQMSKQQKDNLKYIRLADVESSFTILAACTSDSVYEIQCPIPHCGGMGSGGINAYSQRRRRSSSDYADDFLLGSFDLDEEEYYDVEEDEEEEGELIVGGYSTKELQWPFLVGIFRDGEFYCGGSIINDMWILTAAHCNHGYEQHTFEVQAGMTRRYSWSPYEQTRHVDEIYVHEGYDQKIFANDIALYKLNKPLYMSKYVTPACLPVGSEDDPKAGHLCKVAGWGDLHESGSGPDHMQEVSLPVLARCRESFTRDAYQICAGVLEGGKDACQGDSGGPLMCRAPDGRPIVNGVVSFGRGCARADEAGAYTRVSAYLDWIESIINGDHSYATYNPRPKQCTEKCHKPGGECLYAEEKCSGKVDCLGGEDEISCPSYVTRNNQMFDRGGSYYSQPQLYYQPSSYQTVQQPFYYSPGMSRSSSSKSPNNHRKPNRMHSSRGLPSPSGTGGRAHEDKAKKVRRTSGQCFKTEVECASVEAHNFKECISLNSVCNLQPNCFDKSDETDCFALTNDFQQVTNSFSDSEEFKGYVMVRNAGFEWHPLALPQWNMEVGQALCDAVSPTHVTQLKSLETIKLSELAGRLRSGVNLMQSTVVTSTTVSSVLALSNLATHSQFETNAKKADGFTKIHLADDNANVQSDRLILGFVRCQPIT